MKVDLDLMLQSFAETYRDDPEMALRLLQALLLDENACLARIELLKRVRGRAEADFPGLHGKRGETDFATEIQAIVEAGTIRAVKEGTLCPERLAALSRDPDALWQVHEALTQDEAPPPVPRGFTALARQRRWPELKRGLRPYAPILLEEAGLDAALADELVESVVEQARTLEEGQSFRHALPGWIEAFARARKVRARTGDLPWEAIVERGAARKTLEAQLHRQAGVPWARGFCERGLDARLNGPLDILAVELPAELERPATFPGFRRDLVQLAFQECSEGRRLFELDN